MISNGDSKIIGLKKRLIVKTSYNKHTDPKFLDLEMDFSMATVDQVLDWAAADRVIRFQRRLRQMPNENAFDAFHDSTRLLNIFALEAASPLSEHTDMEDVVK